MITQGENVFLEGRKAYWEAEHNSTLFPLEDSFREKPEIICPYIKGNALREKWIDGWNFEANDWLPTLKITFPEGWNIV